jgi:hypothetical protein
METIIPALLKIDWLAALGALTALLAAVAAVASFIPGEEPERTLQKIVDFLSKFSKK